MVRASLQRPGPGPGIVHATRSKSLKPPVPLFLPLQREAGDAYLWGLLQEPEQGHTTSSPRLYIVYSTRSHNHFPMAIANKDCSQEWRRKHPLGHLGSQGLTCAS